MPLERRQTEINSLSTLLPYLRGNSRLTARLYRTCWTREQRPVSWYVTFEGMGEDRLLFLTCTGSPLHVGFGRGMRFEWSLRFFPGGFRYRFENLVLTFFFEGSNHAA